MAKYDVDGNILAVIATPENGPIGSMTKDGRLRITISDGSTKGVYAPDGSLYVTEDDAAEFAYAENGSLNIISSGQGYIFPSMGRRGGGVPAVGALALLSGETDGFAFDFTYAEDDKRVAEKAGGVASYAAPNDAFVQGGSSPKWVFGENGLLTSVSGLAIPYDVVAEQWRGLLVEPASTNIPTYSSQLDQAVWSKSGVTIAANASLAADGTTTADKIIGNAATAQQIIFRSPVGVLDNISYTLSAVLEAAGSTWGYIQIRNKANATVRQWVNLATGAKGTGAGSVENMGGGRYRLSLSQNSSAGAQAEQIVIGPCDADNTTTHTGDGAKGIYVSDVQFEQLGFASSIVPTAGSSVARSADAITKALSALTWFNAGEGSVSLTAAAPKDAAKRVLFQLDDGTSNERIRVERNASNEVHCIVTDGGVDQCDLNLGAVTAGEEFSVAFGWKANDFAASLNAGAEVTDSGGTLPAVTTLRLGCSATANEEWGNIIKSGLLIPRRAA